ncbi:MAG: hypothetical protein M1838_002258 [Thelocarpon superellum]|nr:MAG: hypothetical protein M1838_002258 [Thelocarpon superellum]
MHPGRALWSAKLHDRLQPRTHILLEPDAQYTPSLAPLLERRNSRYRHVACSGFETSSYERIFDEGLLPEQRRRPPGSSHQDEVNPSLLFVANLGHQSAKRTTSSSTSHAMIYRLMTAIRSHTLFHAYGLVRMLIWIADGEKRMILPRTVGDRRKYTVEAEFSLAQALEVAGVEGGAGSSRRERRLDLESAVNVSRSMRERGVTTPAHRKAQITREAEARLDAQDSGDVPDVKQPSGEGRDWQHELHELEARFRRRDFTKFVASASRDQHKGVVREKTPAYARLLALRTFARAQRKNQDQVEQMLEEGAALDRRRSSLEPHPTPEQREQLATATRTLANQVARLPEPVRAKMSLYRDDRQAFATRPPLLSWDRRRDEPLVVQPDEFSPAHALTLLDLRPKAFPSTLQSPEASTSFEYLLSSLFLYPRRTLGESLATLAPGAADALLPQVTAQLQRRGETAELTSVTVRSLSPVMIEALVGAWDAWPFRPSRVEMMTKMGVTPREGYRRT